MTRPRAVLVCGQVPAPEAAQAGHKTAFKYLTDLSKTHTVDLLIACKASDVPDASSAVVGDLRRHARTLQFVPISATARLFGILNGLWRGIAPRFAPRLSGRLLRAFNGLFLEPTPEIVWLEFSQCFWLVEHVSAGIRTVLSAHDIQTQVVSSKSSLEAVSLLGTTFRCEKRFLDRADTVRVQSTKDASLLESFFRLPAAKIEVARPALSSFLETLQRSADKVEAHSILFWGAMGRPENADAAVDFAKRDFATLLSKYPQAKLYIVGSNPTAEVRALAGPSVTVTGFLDDPSSYFERCSLGIAPLLSGAGIKVKVLEMLQAGMPVISTPVGAEGVQGHELLTVADRPGFAEAICEAWR
jgi:glycosyltransferase involved in cell wall biosynthesis